MNIVVLIGELLNFIPGPWCMWNLPRYSAVAKQDALWLEWLNYRDQQQYGIIAVNAFGYGVPSEHSVHQL